MTRGTGYLITDEHMYSHDEFNGDMYRDGHGENFILMLDETTPENFQRMLHNWNANNHSYDNFNTYKELLKEPDFEDHIKVKDDIIEINLNIDYFKWWFSDWIFIKNGSNKDIHIITRSHIDGVAGKIVIIKKDETYAFYFGQAVDPEDTYTAEDVRNNPITKEEDGEN